MDRIANLLNATAVAICDAQTAETSRRCGLISSATAAILMLGQHEGQTVTDVALVAGISHSAMVRLIEGLDRQGLVTRTSGKDKRKIECALTPALASFTTVPRLKCLQFTQQRISISVPINGNDGIHKIRSCTHGKARSREKSAHTAYFDTCKFKIRQSHAYFCHNITQFKVVIAPNSNVYTSF